MNIIKKSLAAGLMTIVAFLGAATAPANAVDNTVNVYLTHMEGWGFLQETPTGTGSLENGPLTPPLGDGSANLIVDSTGGVIIAKAGYNGTKLSDISKLEYSTFRTSGNAALAIALQFNIDNDVTDGDNAWKGRLVYEPYHSNTVNTGVWETWNPLNDAQGTGTGNWFFSNSTLANNSGCTMANPCTWTEVKSAYPNAGVHNTLGGVVLKAGGGWTGGFNGNVDALTIGVSGDNTTYNFDYLPENTPEIPSQCQNINFDNISTGTNKSEKINGTSGNDLIFGLGGSDKIDGKGGHDCIVGGDGSDKLVGGFGNDVILGGNSSDSLEGNDGDDNLYGEDGSDSLKGDNGNDMLWGGNGSDSLRGGNDNDSLDGGDNNDTARGEYGDDTCNAEVEKTCEL